MNIAILDDEEAFAAELAERICSLSALSVYEPETTIFSDGNSLLKDKTEFDLILIDYCLGGKENGLEVARLIRKENHLVRIIFITAYPEYVYDSFKVDAFRYLLKPVSDRDLCDAILAGAASDYQSRVIVITSKKKTECIRVCNIRYVESSGRNSLIHDDDVIFRHVVMSITELEDTLSDYHFCRISRSYLINFDYMRDFTKSYVMMKDDTKLPIGRSRLEAFRKRYIQYLKSKN